MYSATHMRLHLLRQGHREAPEADRTGTQCDVLFRCRNNRLQEATKSTVKCFCDKQNCEDSLICTGELCLIGFRSEGSQAHLEQLCSSTSDTRDLSKCQQNWNGWQEVCACEEDFCNTFAYLRGSIEEENEGAGDDSQSPILHEEESSLDAVRRHRGSNLIVLLVIIPLSVGALAVCLIFINYHCKMC